VGPPEVVLDRVVRVEIWSDVVCPWCYIGTTNLQTAIQRCDRQIDVVFRSYQLDPDAPDMPVPAVEYLAARYGGGRDQALTMMRQVTAVAASVGLQLRLEDSLTGQTLDAHRVLHLAAQRDLQPPVAASLFAAHFTQNRSVFETDSLTELAAEAGLDADEVRAVLADGAYTDEVLADIRQARAYGITGVPFFVFDGRYGVAGAQPPEVLGRVLATAAQANR